MYERAKSRELHVGTVKAMALCLPLALAMFGFPAAGSGQAPFTPELEVQSSTTNAGQATEVNVTSEKQGSWIEERLQSIKLELAQGLFPKLGDSGFCDLQKSAGKYYCAGEATAAGTVKIWLQTDPAEEPLADEEDLAITATAYLEKPQPGELARLVAIPSSSNETVFESSVRLSADYSRVVVEMEEIPTEAKISGKTRAIHAYKIELSLDGGAPYVSGPSFHNPTFCDPGNSVKATFKSYGEDGKSDKGGFGDDTTVLDEVPYPVTGCEGIPYRPAVGFLLGNSNSGEVTSAKSSIDIPQGDATTGYARVSLPAEFKVASADDQTTCPPAAFDSATCPSSSIIGSSLVASPLVEGMQPASLVLGPADGTRLKVGLMADGELPFNLYGFLEQRPDGGIDLLIPDIPPVPISHIEIKLGNGADRGLMNPFSCGTHTATTTLVSHSGKSYSTSNSLVVTGCNSVSSKRSDRLEVSIYPKRPRSWVDMRLKVEKSPARHVSSLKLELPRSLKVRLGRKAGKKKALGYIEVWDDREQVARGALKLDKAKNGLLHSFTVGNRQLRGFKALLEKKKRRYILTLKGLPNREITDITLRLWSRQHKLLRTPGSCKGKLSFKATIKSSGSEDSLTRDSLKLNCKKKEKSKHKAVHRYS